MLNGFPLVSETFVLSQIVGLLNRGHDVDIYADRPGGTATTVHPEVYEYRLVERTRYRAPWPIGKLERIDRAMRLLLRWGWRHPGRTLESVNLVRHGWRASNLAVLLDSVPFDELDAGYDIVHCHFGPNGLRTVAARRAGALEAPVITTFHGYDANVLPRRYGSRYYEYLFRHGDCFTVGSEFMRRRIVSLGAPVERIVHLPMGVDTSRFAYSERLGPRNGHLRLLTVSQLVEAKGIEYVLRAIALLGSQRPRIQYVLAGDGPLRDRLNALTGDLGIVENVTFLGAMARDCVPALYRDADIFVLPSIVTSTGQQENQPVCLAEAQASGLPVIATSIGGVPECMRNGESGLLVPEKDPQAIAQALSWFIEHPQSWARMGRAGRHHVEQYYAVEMLHDRLVDVYRDVLRQQIYRGDARD